ncbi:rDNA transcriptional regulator pol5 [Camellia lanceoleosa]|uniref:rDNA transcriptional regulator pol5 n=1 Tax=Camellia lanceoleosa TaxID=1840588 RepID=A0ACC0IP87_9ERIC|nr:rDNA transcriptional regulator pol5 [Camellia lanceoleosa]
MGSKKRGSSVADEVENQLDTGTDNVVSEPMKKKMKKEKQKEVADGSGTPSSTAQSITSMERRKKRKALDKGKHRETSDDVGAKPKPLDLKVDETWVPMATSPSGGLPEFHISVFKGLASADASVREASVEAMVIELREVQMAYDKLEKKELVDGGLQLEAEKDDGLNNCAPSLRYAVRRLIRGVSSSRECARQGFALGLTILVGAIPSIKVDALLKLIVDLLEVSSSMKGQEVRDCHLGRLFAYGAVARSGRLTEELVSDKKSASIKEFISSLISLAAKKRYLQEPAVSVIFDLIEKLPVKALLNQVVEAPGLQEWFKGAIEVGNPDALLLALRVRERISVDSKVFGKLLPDPYSPSGLFSADHLSSISNCLKESTFCQPRVHSVWLVLVNILLPDMVLQDVDSTSGLNSIKKHKKNRKCSSSEEEIEKNLRRFFEVIVEGCLLSLPTSCVPIVLSYKLVQCLMDILSTKDSWLFKVGQHFLKQLSDWVMSDDVRRVAVIVALQKHSNGKFDSITRTKTVKDLMVEFKTESGCMLLIQNLMSMFLDEGHASEEPSDQSQTTDDNSEIGSIEDKDAVGAMGTSDFLKSWVIDSLPSVLKHLHLDPEAKFQVQKEVLKFLAVQGIFSSSLGTEITSFELQEKFRWPKAATSSALCRMCIEQVQLLLANAQKGEGSHLMASGLETNDLGSYFMQFLNTLCNIPSVSLFMTLNKEDEKAFKKLQAMETRLSREERNCGLSADANKLHALRYLLIQLVLQVLLRPGEFSEAVSELIICCKKAFSTADLLDSSGEDEIDGDGTPMLMDVLVDTLLSLLPQSSAPMRSAIEQVNAGTTIFILTNTHDSEAVVGVETIDKELPEASDDSDGGMDDDAMFRMDSYLARILKERKNQAGGETAHSQLALFKLRVLSLLEIYLQENQEKPQVLKVYSNLAQAFVNPHTAEGSEQLGQCIWGILQKKIFKAKDYPRGESVQLSMLEPLLEKNLKLASKPFKKKKSVANPSKKKQSASWNRHKIITSLAQNSTFWILKIIDSRKFPESELQKVFDIFRGALAAFFESKKSQMKAEFLKDIFRRRPWIGHHLFEFLLEKCCCSKSEFRRIEVLDLVIEILKSLISVSTDESGRAASKKTLNSHLPKLCHLIKELVTNMPEKQARRAEVHAHATCESQLGEAFLALKKR